jgi:hypothetical protein
MRKQVLSLIVPLLAFVLIAAAADTTATGVASSARLQRLEVAHDKDGLRVEFKAKGTLAPAVTTLASPARIVVDLPNTVMATSQRTISVGQDGVKGLRIGMDGQGNTRVVVDLTDSRQHEIVAGADGSFTLKIRDGAVAQRHSSPEKTVAANAAPKLVPVSARGSTSCSGAAGCSERGGFDGPGSRRQACGFRRCRAHIHREARSGRSCRQGSGSGEPLCR